MKRVNLDNDKLIAMTDIAYDLNSEIEYDIKDAIKRLARGNEYASITDTDSVTVYNAIHNAMVNALDNAVKDLLNKTEHFDEYEKEYSDIDDNDNDVTIVTTDANLITIK